MASGGADLLDELVDLGAEHFGLLGEFAGGGGQLGGGAATSLISLTVWSNSSASALLVLLLGQIAADRRVADQAQQGENAGRRGGAASSA